MINYQLFKPVFFENQTCDEFETMLLPAISDPEGYDYIKLIDILQKKVFDKIIKEIDDDISDVALELNFSFEERQLILSEIIKYFEKYQDKKTLLNELEDRFITSFSCLNNKEKVEKIIKIVENKLISINKKEYLEKIFNKINNSFEKETSKKVISLIEFMIKNNVNYKNLSNRLRYEYYDNSLEIIVYSKLLLILVESEKEYFWKIFEKSWLEKSNQLFSV